jgi:guanosine-3',5'-bis(diphosphate) 3'-pyrophosphohydrolase
VHTDIGHACVGARVDRQPYPLSQPLSSGQTVEIITAPGARPNAAWLNFVVSSKARAKIRQLLKNLKRDDSVSLGRRLLNHALGGSRKLAEIPPENIQRELERMKLASLDDLLAEIGLGNAMSVVVAKNLQQGEACLRQRIRPRSSANQRRGRGADHLRQMLPSNSRRPDYCARQPG